MGEHQPHSSGHPRPSRILLRPRVVSGNQKRASERTSTVRTVLARLESQDRPIEVPLMNISPTGLQISTGRPVEVNESLYVEVLPGRILKATTKWAREDDGNYLIGAEWETAIPFDDVWRIRTEYEN